MGNNSHKSSSKEMSKEKTAAIKRTLKLNKVYKTNIAELGQILSDLEVLNELMVHIRKEIALGDKEDKTKGFVDLKLNKIPKKANNKWFKGQNVEVPLILILLLIHHGLL